MTERKYRVQNAGERAEASFERFEQEYLAVAKQRDDNFEKLDSAGYIPKSDVSGVLKSSDTLTIGMRGESNSPVRGRIKFSPPMSRRKLLHNSN